MAQFKLAERNAAMAIWLGKQYLGQRENKLDLEEQEARIEQLRANTERIRRNDSEEGEDSVVIVNDAPTGEVVGDSNPEISTDIQ